MRVNLPSFTEKDRADTLVGNARDNVLSGLGGNDTLTGLAGNDTFAGGVGSESGLYFELRHQGQALDPLKWVSR